MLCTRYYFYLLSYCNINRKNLRFSILSLVLSVMLDLYVLFHNLIFLSVIRLAVFSGVLIFMWPIKGMAFFNLFVIKAFLYFDIDVSIDTFRYRRKIDQWANNIPLL